MDDGVSTLMSIRDAAQATGLSPKALRRRIERGTLASVMIGGRRRIPVEALARRGLIPLEPAALSVQRLTGRGGSTEWTPERLHRLEARVSALERVLSDAASPASGDGASSAAQAAGAALAVTGVTGVTGAHDGTSAGLAADGLADRMKRDRPPVSAGHDGDTG